MGRNLDRRVEILFPVLDPRLIRQVKTEVLDTGMADTVKARVMQADGSYRRAETPAGGVPLDCQAELIKRRLAAVSRT
jgi:polyphosphate kinase